MVEQRISEERMERKKDTPSDSKLRQLAEKELDIDGSKTELISEMSPENMATLIHELQVHQIELKMQNDELRRIHEELEESRDKYSHLYDFAPIGYFTVTEKGIIDETNLTLASMLGVTRTDLLGQPFSRFILKEDQDIFYEHRQRLLETEISQSCELRLLKKGGDKFYARLEYLVIKEKKHNLRQIRVAVSDITEQKRMEADRERHLAAIEQIAEGVVITDTNGNMEYVNPAFEKITGYSRQELIGQNPRILKSGEHDELFYQQLWETIASGNTWNGRLTNKKKGGMLYTEDAIISPVLDKSGKIINFVAVKRDITDEIRMEERLQQSQKMESIGTLAGGIAHDFNNILFPLIGYAEMLKEDLPHDSPEQESITQVLNAAFRAKDLVTQILAFSRQDNQALKPVRLQSIFKDVFKLLKASIPTTIEVKTEVDPDCDVVVADPTQIHQVIMNLVTNAYHAMQESGGQLEVSLKQVEIESRLFGFSELLPGNYALLKVTDTGPGIKKEIMDKIFEPYFTTKETGKGTGLGLSIVQGIVKNCHGDIHVYSEPGKGTEFHVYLPIMKKLSGIESFDPSELIQGGTERILLVDDEEIIVKMEKLLLERLGYNVTTRTGSVEALEAFKAKPDAYDLIISDMTMPNMTGVQLADKIKAIRTDIPFIICTGYSDQINEKTSRSLGIQGYVMKPVIKNEIAKTICNVLAAAKSKI